MRLNEQIGLALLGQQAERLSSPELRPCTFTRANGPVFYAVAATLLMTARWYALRAQTADAFTAYPAFREWLLEELAPKRLVRVERLREYATITWPELDWTAADDRFNRLLDSNAPPPEACPARRALRQCVAASQTAVFFRCLTRWAEDARLRALAAQIAAEEAEAFARCRALYDETHKQHPLGFRNAWRTVSDAMRAARDVYVQCAFDALITQWGPNAPFPALSYAELTRRIAAAAQAHAELSWQERLVFKPWKEKPRPLAFDVRQRTQPGFRPVLVQDDARRTGVADKGQWRP